MKLRVFDTIATPLPQKKKLQIFFLTLSNKRNKMSGGHDRRTQGGKSRCSPGGGGGGGGGWENK